MSLGSLFTDIANAIRAKKGTTDKIKASNFASEIASIQTGGGSGGETGEAYGLQWKCDNIQNLYNECYGFTGTSIDPLLNNIDTSKVTSTASMFQNCRSLTSVPLFNTSNVTNMQSMFSGCSALMGIPEFDTGKVTLASQMFSGCSNIRSVPSLDFHSLNNASNMFYNCTYLQTVPYLNTQGVSDFSNMFYGCKYLQSIEGLNTKSASMMKDMFTSCESLTTIPLLNTSNVYTMQNMFKNCYALTTVPAMDVSNVTNFKTMFMSCTNLKSVLMTGIKYPFDISASGKFEREDLVTILNNLETVTNYTVLTMGSTNLAKLTDDDKAIATNKGWTLA